MLLIRFFVVGLAAAYVVGFGSQPLAQGDLRVGPSSAIVPVPRPMVTAAAQRLLEEMGAYVGSANQFTFHADISFDHVLPTGQKLQFSAIEDVGLQRPNKLYVQWSGDLGNRQLWYDGKSITLYDPQTALYAAVPAAADLDGTLQKLGDELNFVPPLSDFLSISGYKNIRTDIQYGFSLGNAEIAGRNCTSLAFVQKNIDWQIWIDSGAQRVPCKLIITYKTNPSLPQFIATFTNWDFAPHVAQSAFTASLPSDAQKIPIVSAATATTASK